MKFLSRHSFCDTVSLIGLHVFQRYVLLQHFKDLSQRLHNVT